MAVRERQFNVLVGAPGHGKTTFVSRLVAAQRDSNVLIYKNHLNIDDKALSAIPYVKEIYKYKGGKAKISDYNIQYKPFMQLIKKSYRNGQLIIDDAGLYERDIITDELRDLIMMRRHMGVDVLYVYHGMTFLPIQQFPFINNIILFHTTDNIDYKLSRVPGGDLLKAARARIAAQVGKGNKYYHEVIKLS